MQPSESKPQFEQFVAAAGSSAAALAPSEAVRLMLAFYRQVRAEGCSFDTNGDMVLFQWGTFDFGEGETYHYDLTRQFIVYGPGEDEHEMSQLSLTVHFAVTDQLRALQKGNGWCSWPAEADEFERFIASQEVTAAVASLCALRTTLGWRPT